MLWLILRGGRDGWIYKLSILISMVSLTGTLVNKISTSNEANIPLLNFSVVLYPIYEH